MIVIVILEKIYQVKIKHCNQFLEKHLNVDSICYIPLSLVSFLSLVEHDAELPKTQAELTGNTVRLTVTHNKDTKEQSIEARRISIFEDKDIDKSYETIFVLYVCI